MLKIEVLSFSYKKGYPQDKSGNGGGFMFDCRFLNNPGRYDEYKHLTGLDQPVRDFLREKSEIHKFIDQVVTMVSPAIENYMRRGFDHLQIGFGCTGGRHRSVYSADNVGRILREKYPDVKVSVTHTNLPKEPKVAFLLCAGLGSRLKPWTLTNPKALVPVGGVPMMQRVVNELVDNDFMRVVVNVHHFADKVEEFSDYLMGENKDLKIYISDERNGLLETGGGVLHAEPQLLDAAKECGKNYFLVHNVDILSNADITELVSYHEESGALATLLVSDRDSNRKLVFDTEMNLCGWHSLNDNKMKPEGFISPSGSKEYAFSGIYVLSTQVFDEMRKKGYSGKFSIIDFLLTASKECKIKGYLVSNLQLTDIGKPDTLELANRQWV